MRCGNPAKHTQRLVESSDLIVVGARGMYEARCRRCFEPGMPKQTFLEFAAPRSKPPSGTLTTISSAPFGHGSPLSCCERRIAEFSEME